MEVGECMDLRDNIEADLLDVLPNQMRECEDKRGVKGEVQKSVIDNQVLFTEPETQKEEQISGKNEFWTSEV